MYRIGIVEDSEDEIAKIERTLDFFNIDFDMSYYFSERTYTPENIVEKLSSHIIIEIQSDKIDGLIIDYKIVLDDIIIEGNEIYREINMVIPKFPIIILTEIVDEPEGKTYMDADKVYRKSTFFNFESRTSKDMYTKFFKNMDHYRGNRQRYRDELNKKKETLVSEGIKKETILEIVDLENELSKYENIGNDSSDSLLDSDSIAKAINLIKQVDEMIDNEKS
ncbi:hypothetical protein HCI96_04145 [Listeria seeligeri]|uniref:hypothetical protein n=1 Tax=Listeria seeligeri TaxID=1640 RepID=UPI001626C98E|nr:hypothetical protein [Listeria seeligeri]MBC1424175.1 hypothetical protein [Listeria seeligeri]MBC1775222.1 hypothetical protein [Listeria seeligeri]MBC1826332.1 hypothetical protein [Listeria seeligeri]MBC6119381.1 hypothetical protein [Listeria seeligeri]MBC6142674.1 hypothetical protein [Listeria seeligeri]